MFIGILEVVSAERLGAGRHAEVVQRSEKQIY
jgi:hypothetical protein